MGTAFDTRSELPRFGCANPAAGIWGWTLRVGPVRVRRATHSRPRTWTFIFLYAAKSAIASEGGVAGRCGMYKDGTIQGFEFCRFTNECSVKRASSERAISVGRDRSDGMQIHKGSRSGL